MDSYSKDKEVTDYYVKRAVEKKSNPASDLYLFNGAEKREVMKLEY